MDILIDFDPRLNRMQISNPSAGNRESRGAVTRLYNFYEEGFNINNSDRDIGRMWSLQSAKRLSVSVNVGRTSGDTNAWYYQITW